MEAQSQIPTTTLLLYYFINVSFKYHMKLEILSNNKSHKRVDLFSLDISALEFY